VLLVSVPQEAAACSWTLVICSKWRHVRPLIDVTCIFDGTERIWVLSLGFSTFFIKTLSQLACWLGSKSMMGGVQTSEPPS